MAFTDIAITAPSSAEEGKQVSVSARVTNISGVSFPFRVRLYAVRDIFEVPKPGDLFGTFEETIESGQSQVISGSFTMPAWNTNVLVMVHRFINFWDFDNLATKVVSLKTKAALSTILKMVGISALAVLAVALAARKNK